MRKVFIIPLLIILGFSQFGYYLSSNISIAQCHEQREELSTAENEKIVVINYSENKALIRWEDNDEFYYNNEIYDLVKSTHENGKELLYCINDSKEKQLINERDDQTAHNTETGKKQKLASFDLIFISNLEVDIPHVKPQISIIQHIFYSQQLPQGNNDSIFLPPRMLA